MFLTFLFDILKHVKFFWARILLFSWTSSVSLILMKKQEKLLTQAKGIYWIHTNCCLSNISSLAIWKICLINLIFGYCPEILSRYLFKTKLSDTLLCILTKQTSCRLPSDSTLNLFLIGKVIAIQSMNES